MYGNNFGYNGYGGYRVPTGYQGQQSFVPQQGNQPFGGFPPAGQQNDGNNAGRPALQVPWVNGEIGAQAYIIAPNSALILMDSDNPIFYIKTSDSSGRASIQAFRYEELKPTQAQPVQDNQMYVTKEEFERFKASILNKTAEEVEEV